MKKIDKKVPNIFNKLRKLLAKNQYEDLNKLFSQEKYVSFFQKVYQLDGKEVQKLVDEIMASVLENSKEQTNTIFKGKRKLDEQTILNLFQKMLRDQLIQIYFISVLFYQFDELVFKAFHQMSLQQYCLKKILDGSNNKFSKKIVNYIVNDLNNRKNKKNQSKAFSSDLLSIINFFSYRTFLNELYLEKDSYDFNMSVHFNCDLTEEMANNLIKHQERKRQEQEKFKIMSDFSEDSEEEEAEDKSEISENQEEDKSQMSQIQEEDSEEKGEKSMEIELENKKQKKKYRKRNSQNKKALGYESLYNQIEDNYINQLKIDSKKLIDSLQPQRLEEQIEQIEDYIFKEQRFISYYMNRSSIKITDILYKICVYDNYSNLISHSKYGLDYIFKIQNYSELRQLYDFVQNESESIKILANALNQIAQNKIKEIDDDQYAKFSDYKKEQISQEKSQMKSIESKDESMMKDIRYLQVCQQKWVQSINQIYVNYFQNGLIETLDNNPALNAALSRAFETQFNQNELVVEYLVNSCHQCLLQKKFRQIDLGFSDKKFENLIQNIFTFICQKDSFFEIYRSLLSRRLIYQQTKGIDEEKKFLEIFEKVNGKSSPIEYMKIMIDDIKKNDLLKEEYEFKQNDIENEDNSKQKEENNSDNQAENNHNHNGQIQIIDDSLEIPSRNSPQRAGSGNRNLIEIEDNEEEEDGDFDEEDSDREESNSNSSQGDKKNRKSGSKSYEEFIQIEESKQEDEQKEIEISSPKPLKQKRQEKVNKQKIEIVVKDENKQNLTNVSIFTDFKWPLKQTTESSQTILPKFLENQYNQFAEFYKKPFQNQRKLQLLHHYSYSTVQFRSDFKKKFDGFYTLQVSSYSMIILLCFNQNNSMNVSQLHKQTGISKKTIKEKLNILSRHNILKLKDIEEDTNFVEVEDSRNVKNYQINIQFQAKEQELEIDSVPEEIFYSQKIIQNIREDAQSKKIVKETTSEVNHHRKHILNSFIVKIMKEKETLHQDELIKLIKEKVTSSKQLFTAADNLIKDQIQDCIEKDYLKFSTKEDEKNVIIYQK